MMLTMAVIGDINIRASEVALDCACRRQLAGECQQIARKSTWHQT